MANCNSNNGAIDITSLTLQESQQIKLALFQQSKKYFPATTREDRSFIDSLITMIDKAQNEACHNLTKQPV